MLQPSDLRKTAPKPLYPPTCFLVGVLAAKLSKTGVAGWIAGYQAVPAPSALSAFVLGARSVNPNFILKAVFLNTYSDPPKEKAAVESLIAEGADVIGHGLASPTIVQTAEERQVYSFGRMAQCTWGPKYCMASSSINWEALLQNMIQQAMDGSWKNNMVYWAGVKDGSMDVIEINASLPADVKQLIATTKQKIGSGEIQIFRGPIMDNTGAEMVPAGKTLTPEEAAVQTKWAAGLQKK